MQKYLRDNFYSLCELLIPGLLEPVNDMIIQLNFYTKKRERSLVVTHKPPSAFVILVSFQSMVVMVHKKCLSSEIISISNLSAILILNHCIHIMIPIGLIYTIRQSSTTAFIDDHILFRVHVMILSISYSSLQKFNNFVQLNRFQGSRISSVGRAHDS